MSGLCLLFAIIFQAETTKATVPFTMHNNSMVVQVRINDKGPYPLLLDTGATLSVVSRDVGRRLRLKPTKQMMMSGVGSVSQVGVVELRSISLGGAKARKVEAAIRDIPALNKKGIAGLLGQDFLFQFNMSVDNQKKQLTFSLSKDTKTKKTAKKLSPLEKQVAQVYDDPKEIYEPVHELYRKVREAYRQKEGDWDGFSKQWAKLRGDLYTLNQYLSSFSKSELDLQAANNLQRFLYCYPGYRKHLEAMGHFLTAMKAPKDSAMNQTQPQKWEATVRTRELYGSCF